MLLAEQHIILHRLPQTTGADSLIPSGVPPTIESYRAFKPGDHVLGVPAVNGVVTVEPVIEAPATDWVAEYGAKLQQPEQQAAAASIVDDLRKGFSTDPNVVAKHAVGNPDAADAQLARAKLSLGETSNTELAAHGFDFSRSVSSSISEIQNRHLVALAAEQHRQQMNTAMRMQELHSEDDDEDDDEDDTSK